MIVAKEWREAKRVTTTPTISQTKYYQSISQFNQPSQLIHQTKTNKITTNKKK